MKIRVARNFTKAGEKDMTQFEVSFCDRFVAITLSNARRFEVVWLYIGGMGAHDINFYNNCESHGFRGGRD